MIKERFYHSLIMQMTLFSDSVYYKMPVFHVHFNIFKLPNVGKKLS